MKTKINELLNSRKFWIATITAVFAIVSYYFDIPEEVKNILIIYGTTVLGIGVADSLATKFGGTTVVNQHIETGENEE